MTGADARRHGASCPNPSHSQTATRCCLSSNHVIVVSSSLENASSIVHDGPLHRPLQPLVSTCRLVKMPRERDREYRQDQDHINRGLVARIFTTDNCCSTQTCQDNDPISMVPVFMTDHDGPVSLEGAFQGGTGQGQSEWRAFDGDQSGRSQRRTIRLSTRDASALHSLPLARNLLRQVLHATPPSARILSLLEDQEQTGETRKA